MNNRRSRLLAVCAAGILTVTSFAGRPAANGAPTKLLRMPTVSATQIGFAYANNIWTVERAGGMARRLTSFHGQTTNPHFSPDGKWIAFSGEYAGNVDVYVLPAEGGEPKRLTWHPGADSVQGWMPDGKSIVFASGRASAAPSAAPRFWTVPAQGGVEEPMPLPRAYQGKISPSGTHVAYRMNNSWDDERRNYRGGQNRPIWIVDLKTFDLVSPPWTDSKDIDPVWVGDTVFFLSDRDGVSNVWSFDTKGKKLAQVTKFPYYDVKSMDANHGVVVFEQAGEIHELDPKTGRDKIVPITAVGDFPWMMPRWEDVTARMSNLGLSPTGKRVVVEARGEIFTIPAEKGDVRNLTNSSASAERDPAWSPDGKYVSYFSDKSGEYKLMIESQEGLATPREIALDKPSHYYTPSWSPDSKKLLYTDTNLNVWVMDVESGKAKVVGRDPWMVPQRTVNPVWSPDSKWIAYAAHLNSLYKAIFISNAETGESKQITDGLADATWPVFDASGKYLWFFASTDFGLRSQWLDMTSYDRTENFGLYLAVLKKGEPSPLLPESDEDTGVPFAPGRGEFGGGGRGRGGAPGATPADTPAPTADAQAAPAPAATTTQSDRAPRTGVTVQIDFDGLQQRILAIPGVPVREYSKLKAGVAGTVYYLETGGGSDDGGAGGTSVNRYRLSDRRAATFVASAADYTISADGRKLLYRAGGGGGRGGGRAGGGAAPAGPALFLVDADRTPPQAGQGRLTATLRMYLEPREEYRQIFMEGWRNQRDYLYVPNMHGTNWHDAKERYGSLLQYVNHRADLNYLLDNMGAEIAIGHSYVRGGDMPAVPTSLGGLLGADFTIEGGRYKIARIYDAESWNPDLRAPLAAPGVDVKVGDFVVAVNGAELKAPDNIYRLLDGTANRQTVIAPGDGDPRRQRADAAHAGVGGSEPPSRRQAVERPARLRAPAQHRAAGLPELQPLLLRAAGQEGGDHRRALQRWGLGGRLHHRRPRARLRRLLQQRGRRSRAVHQPGRRDLGAEGDDHQRDGRVGRRLDALHVPPPQDRPARRQADVGWSGAHGRHAGVRRRRLDDRAARRLHRSRRQVVGRERRCRSRHRRRELAEGRDRRQRSAARARGRRSAAAAQTQAGGADDDRAAAADPRQAQRRLMAFRHLSFGIRH
jgi:tricorn protease